MLYKIIFYFYKFYIMKYIMYFAINNHKTHTHTQICVCGKYNLIKKDLNYITIILFYINVKML